MSIRPLQLLLSDTLKRMDLPWYPDTTYRVKDEPYAPLAGIIAEGAMSYEAIKTPWQ